MNNSLPNSWRLAPTIVSRCHRVRIAVPAPTEALAWLQARNDRVDWAPILGLAGSAPIRALEYHAGDVAGQVAEFEQDIDALERRRASPTAVAKRWASADGELCLSWLYRRISAEIKSSQQPGKLETASTARGDDLQNGAENLHFERAFAELRQLGELRKLHGSGLNADLQLSAILTRWYGQR